MRLTLGLLSIITGCMIYVFWRSENLLMFIWFEKIKLISIISFFRSETKIVLNILPNWFYFSLPSALWLFGGILIFSEIWKDYKAEKLLWITIFVFIGLGSELGQLINVVPGTYDLIDMIIMIIFGIAAVLVDKLTLKRRKDCEVS